VSAVVRWRKSGTVAAFTIPGDPWWSLERDWHVRAHLAGCVAILDYEAMAAAGDLPGATYAGRQQGSDDTITFTGEALAALRASELAAVERLEQQGMADVDRLFEIAKANDWALPAEAPIRSAKYDGEMSVRLRLQVLDRNAKWHQAHDALGLCVERLGYQIGWRDSFMPCATAQLVPLEGPRVDWLEESRAYWQGVES
jgi:hypothetical protein